MSVKTYETVWQGLHIEDMILCQVKKPNEPNELQCSFTSEAENSFS